VCLSVGDHIFRTTRPIFTKCSCMLSMSVARSSSGGVVIRYVLLVLWMTSYLLISQGCSTSPTSWSAVHTQPLAWLLNVRCNTSCKSTNARDYFLGAQSITSRVAGDGVCGLWPCNSDDRRQNVRCARPVIKLRVAHVLQPIILETAANR